MIRKRMKFWSVMMTVFPLLAACSSTNGLLPETYSGTQIKRNEEAIVAYADAKQIIGEEKEEYFPAVMPDYYFKPSLPFLKEKVVQLTTVPQVAGIDFPEGRYVVEVPEFMPGANLLVQDEEGHIVFQEVLGFMNDRIEVNFYDHYSVSIMGQKDSYLMASSSAAHSQRVAKKEEVSLTDGFWKVGEHIPSGTYSLSRPETFGGNIPFLYLIQPDGTYRVFELLGGMNHSVHSPIQVELKEKETIFIEKTHILTFTKTVK